MKTALATLLTALFFGVFTQNNLKVGDKVPNFKAITAYEKTWELKNNLDNNYLVVYFYPAAMTGGCTTQACSYRDLSNELDSFNVKVVGISGDRPESLKFFIQAHNLNFTLLSDTSGEIAELFGVPTREGTTFKGQFEGKDFELERDITTSRWTFILDKNGKIVYKNEQVKASEDPQEVLNFLRNNS